MLVDSNINFLLLIAQHHTFLKHDIFLKLKNSFVRPIQINLLA